MEGQSGCQGDDTFVAFQPMGIFRFWRKRELTFSEDIHNSSIFLGPHPYPLNSLVLRWRPDPGRFHPRV